MQTIARAIQYSLSRTIIATFGAVAMLAAAGTVEAQQRTSLATGTARAELRANVGVEMPVVMRFGAESAPTATAQEADYTEYTLRYTVRTNARWEVVATEIPQGVTVLNVDGSWEAAGASAPTLERGVWTNGTEVVIRVRVANGADLGWQQALQVEARRRF